MMFPPGMFEPPELTDEQKKLIDDLRKAEADNQIAWRRTQTGAWGMLFCSCGRDDNGLRVRSVFDYRPDELVTAGCRVHGGFIITYEGEVI